jgi:hypothetical protein
MVEAARKPGTAALDISPGGPAGVVAAGFDQGDEAFERALL